MMREEDVTKCLLNWLEINGWHIISYDFPHSGTGICLHPNVELRTSKNKGAIIPDIIAIKSNTVVFFENKDRFVLSDFLKVSRLKSTDDYTNSIKKLLIDYDYSKIYYGVGLPLVGNITKKIMKHLDMIEFALLITEDRSISLFYQNDSIFP